MSGLHDEELAREIARVLVRKAEQDRRVRQLLRAKRFARQTENAASRARLALARAI